MMVFEANLISDLVQIDSTAMTKTAVLSEISRLFTKRLPHLQESELFDLFWQREQLGSTSVGHGAAIPHVRCSQISRSLLACVRLAHPIDFGGLDRQPCDLFFALIVPEHEYTEHLNLLSSICESLQSQTFRQACRSATSAEDFESILCSKKQAYS